MQSIEWREGELYVGRQRVRRVWRTSAGSHLYATHEFERPEGLSWFGYADSPHNMWDHWTHEEIDPLLRTGRLEPLPKAEWFEATVRR